MFLIFPAKFLGGGKRTESGEMQTRMLYHDMDENSSAFLSACSRGWTEEVKRLLGEDADIQKPDSVGFSALHRAAYHGHGRTVRLLLDEGARVNCLTKVWTHPEASPPPGPWQSRRACCWPHWGGTQRS